MPHGGDRAMWRGGDRQEVAAGLVDLVAVAHPDDRVGGDVAEERVLLVEHATVGAAVLAAGRVGLDAGPQRVGGKLQAVADPQDRDAELEELRVAFRGAGLIHAPRSAREDQGQRIELADTLGRDVVPDDPREGVPLTHPTRDELHVLRAEIQDEHGPRRRTSFRHEPPFPGDQGSPGSSLASLARPIGLSIRPKLPERPAIVHGWGDPPAR